MEIIAFIGAIIALLVGAVELQNYLKEPENEKLVRLISVIAISATVVVFVAHFIYFGPKSTGEYFLSGLRNMNNNEMLAVTCVNSELYDALAGFGGSIIGLGGLFANTRITNEAFIPIANQFKFTWIQVSSFAGNNEAQNATLYVHSSGLTNFCIGDVDGL